MRSMEFWDSVKRGEISAVEQLVTDEPELLKLKGEWGWTALHCAVSTKTISMVNLLVAQGAEVDARDNNGETVLFQIADIIPEYTDIMLLLLKAGADINAKNTWGRTPLHETAIYGDYLAAQFLIDHGAEVNSKDNNGLTPLHIAAEDGLPDMITLLIANGASVNAASIDGNTALHWAIMANIMRHKFQYHLATIETLLQHNADIMAQSLDAKYPLDLARAQIDYPEIAALLVQYGAGQFGHWLS